MKEQQIAFFKQMLDTQARSAGINAPVVTEEGGRISIAFTVPPISEPQSFSVDLDMNTIMDFEPIKPAISALVSSALLRLSAKE